MFKNLIDLPRTLTTFIACVILCVASKLLLHTYQSAVPGGIEVLCTVLFIIMIATAVYNVINDVDAWPGVIAIILTIIIAALQLGYKSEAKFNSIPVTVKQERDFTGVKECECLGTNSAFIGTCELKRNY